jgi:SAM-dependent methyltransferase
VPAKDETYRQLGSAIEETLRACAALELVLLPEPQTLKEVQSRFRDAIAQWFDQSWFMHRSKVKPRGYPGDYRMLTSLYDHVPVSRGLGGYIELWIYESELGRAVCTRLQSAYDFLNDELSERHGEVSILNVACGPFHEYTKGFHAPDDCKVTFHCIDADTEALDYVKAQLKPVSQTFPQVNLVHYNALRMTSVKANLEKFGWPDIIYSIGLCDYIPDDYMIGLLRGWRESLNDNGIVYVAFKDTRQYDKTVYQWLEDWYFFQRTEQDCRRLYEEAGYDMGRLEMTRDATGIIMNFKSRVKARKHLRIDAPELQGKRRPTAVPAQEEALESN